MADESTLDPEARELLERMEESPFPAVRELPPAEARETFDGLNLLPPEEREPVGGVEDRTIPGPGGDLRARVYTPAPVDGGDGGAREGPLPTLVYFHGGGWVLGTLETHDSTCRALANDGECVVVSVDYRLAPEHPFPAAVADARAATEWIAANPGEVGGDGRLAVGGDSAGGTLAAVVALLARDFDGPDLDHQLLIYPATSAAADWDSYEESGEGYYLERADIEYFLGHYLRDELEAYNRYAFPMEARTLADLPPATVMTCGFDPLRDEGTAYADRLEEAGVPVRHRRYEGLIHGAVSMLGEPGVSAGREALADLGDDLRAAFER